MFYEKTMEAGASSGTTDLTLGTSVAGWKTWLSQAADLSIVFYYAEIADGSIWESGYGTLTDGATDKIANRVLLLSSTGSLVDFAGATVYVMSIPNADAMRHLIGGGLAASRPGWLPNGGRWTDSSAGIATRLIDYIKHGTPNAEMGRYDGAKGIYVSSNAAPIRDTTTSGSTIGVNDRGYIVSHDTSAAVRVAALPAVATATEGFYVGIYADGIFPVFLDTNSSEAIDNAVVPPGQVVWVRCTGAKWLTQGNANQALIGRRQTVTRGPLSAGAPNLLATVSGLALSTSNVAAASPLVVRASNSGAERWGWSTGNVSFGTLTNTASNYLFVTVGGDGLLTGGNTTLAPVYQESGTPSTTSGQFTFNYGEMKGYVGNGSTADEVFRVYVGEADTSGGNVTAVTAYAYNGRYDGAFTANFPSSSTAISKNHNIGTYPGSANVIVECTTIDRGYAVGDRIISGIAGTDAVPSFTPLPIWINRNTCGFSVLGGGTAWYGTNKSVFSSGGFTLSSWKYKMTADRGW